MEDDELNKIRESTKLIKGGGIFSYFKNKKINKKKKELIKTLENLELTKLDYNKYLIEKAIKFYEDTIKLDNIKQIQETAKKEEI